MTQATYLVDRSEFLKRLHLDQHPDPDYELYRVCGSFHGNRCLIDETKYAPWPDRFKVQVTIHPKSWCEISFDEMEPPPPPTQSPHPHDHDCSSRFGLWQSTKEFPEQENATRPLIALVQAIGCLISESATP